MVLRFGIGMGVVGVDTAARAVGVHLPGVSHVEPKDARFASPAWNDNFVYHGLLETLPRGRRDCSRELVHAARIEGPAGPKAEFATQLVADALAPTNFLLTNPAALERAFETAGLSLVRGARNFVHDVLHNDGWPRQVDRSPFVLGPHHRGHARQGRVPQRADRAAPVHAADRATCTRCPLRGAARRGSTATTSPTSRPGRAWWSGRCDAGTPCSR